MSSKKRKVYPVFVYTCPVKVLLVQPPIEDFYDTSIRTYPLSLLYIATMIRDICHVSVVDFRSNRKPRRIADHPFSELTTYYRQDRYTPLSLFKRFSRFGADRDEIKQKIASEKPDVVAVSSLFSTYSEEAIDVARCVKEVSPGILTVLGGIHPTLFPKHVLQSAFVDYVVRGEGETPFFRLIEALKSGNGQNIDGLPGIASKDQHRYVIPDIHIEADIDLIPDRTFLDPESYRIGRKNYTFFLTSRGCPFHCTFCGRPPFPYRVRSLGSIENEIEECLALGIQAIDFEDDMLTLDRVRFNLILDLFKDTGVTLSAMNGIYSDNLDVPTLEHMYRAGFQRLNFSLVDASKAITDQQKRHNADNFTNLLPYLEASESLVETHFIIGLPSQQIEHILDTIIFLMGKRLLLGPSIFYLAPNSEAYQQFTARNEGSGQQFKLMRSSAMESLYTLMKLVRFVNLVKRLLDGNNAPIRLSDILEMPAVTKNERDKKILTTLLNEKGLIWFDGSRSDFVPEPHNGDLVRLFFERARNKTIRGFKTMNQLVVD
jgi:anaerobic magnesium-protoporphyrin IX monomethyl ester cyclase